MDSQVRAGSNRAPPHTTAHPGSHLAVDEPAAHVLPEFVERRCIETAQLRPISLSEALPPLH